MEVVKTFFATALRFVCEHFFKGVCHFLNIEFTRATATLISDVAILPNDVHPVGHRVECAGNGITNVINQHWNRKIQINRTSNGDFLTALECLGLFNLQRGRPRRLQRVCFADVNPIEISLFTKSFVSFLEAHGLTREGASGVGSKNHH